METTPPSTTSRREFIKQTSRIAAASALAGVALPHVHAAGSDTIQLALIGCGGRGTGAVANAMSAGGLVLGDNGGTERAAGSGAGGPIKLVAMADLRQEKIDSSYTALNEQLGQYMDVPKERRFVGFDAYKHAIDSLKPGDVAMLCTHCGFRAPHMEYAIEKGINVFMEKEFAADPGGIKRILKAGEAAEKKNLKVAAGLMCRHSSARQAMIEQIRAGKMGDIELIRAYRMDSGYGLPPFPKGSGESEVLWQLTSGRPYQFMWASGGLFIELMIHQMDECFWIKDAWPVSAHGVGGRRPGSQDAGQSFDTYSVEFAFADGSRAMVTGRYMPKCFNDFGTYVQGSKCSGKFSGNIHAPTSMIFKDKRAEFSGVKSSDIAWRAPKEMVNPWQAEWDVLLSAIRNDKPHNETKRAALSNLGAIMGRAAVHTGQIVTWDQAMASDFMFCKNIDSLTADSPAPAQSDANGHYAAPIPGQTVEI